jgi:homoserine dehydrogenase
MISVGLVPVKLTDTLGVLDGTDNQFTFTTSRYREQPLTIRGPGAGAAVTAAGVMNDVLALGARLSAIGPRPSAVTTEDPRVAPCTSDRCYG